MTNHNRQNAGASLAQYFIDGCGCGYGYCYKYSFGHPSNSNDNYGDRWRLGSRQSPARASLSLLVGECLYWYTELKQVKRHRDTHIKVRYRVFGERIKRRHTR